MAADLSGTTCSSYDAEVDSEMGTANRTASKSINASCVWKQKVNPSILFSMPRKPLDGRPAPLHPIKQLIIISRLIYSHDNSIKASQRLL